MFRWGGNVEAVERRKGFFWSREDTSLLISQYREHEKLFRNVNCKKKSVWELITASMAAENPWNFSARPEQVEGKRKSLTLAFRKRCDHNSMSGNDRKECPCYREIAEFYGYRPNVYPVRQAAALGRLIEKSRHFSEPAVFVAQVAKRQKKSADFFV